MYGPPTTRLRLGVLAFLLVQLQVQLQVQLASLYLDLALVDLSGVGGGLSRATPAEVVQVKLKST